MAKPGAVMKSTSAELVNIHALFPAIAAASILAKVVRDREMVAFDQQYPGYGFAGHKGYPTKVHMAAIEELGVTPIHRLTFGPVKRYVEQLELL